VRGTILELSYKKVETLGRGSVLKRRAME